MAMAEAWPTGLSTAYDRVAADARLTNRLQITGSRQKKSAPACNRTGSNRPSLGESRGGCPAWGGCTARPLDQTFVCVWSSTGRKKAMQDRVPRDRVRLAAPRMQPLSAEQEHEATRLLAALLADAAERQPRGSAVPIGVPFRSPIPPPFAPPVGREDRRAWKSPANKPDRRLASNPDNRGGS